jgi:pimeloyl-ACP methyl ester carboxylesterase
VSAEDLSYEPFASSRIATVYHRAHARPRRVVIMAHGFRSSKIGPSRYFVDLGRALVAEGISAFRFDQLGSGDSDRAFEDSSFLGWIDAIEHFARRFASGDYAVSLLGQSLGGRATLAAAARLGTAVRCVALWSPAPMLTDRVAPTNSGWMEEEGQRVRWEFWREAESIDFLELYRALAVPAYIVFGTEDAYIPVHEIRQFETACKEGDRIRVVEGLPHSAWPEPHRTQILRETLEFLSSSFTRP